MRMDVIIRLIASSYTSRTANQFLLSNYGSDQGPCYLRYRTGCDFCALSGDCSDATNLGSKIDEKIALFE